MQGKNLNKSLFLLIFKIIWGSEPVIEVDSKFGRLQPFLVIGFMTESGSRGSLEGQVQMWDIEDFHQEHLGQSL